MQVITPQIVEGDVPMQCSGMVMRALCGWIFLLLLLCAFLCCQGCVGLVWTSSDQIPLRMGIIDAGADPGFYEGGFGYN